MTSSDLLAGRYRLTRQLGQGSFAETYLADDMTLGRPVAVKILRSQYAQDERFALRFEREARAAAAVRHRNVVDVFDYGQDGSTLYLVMEWVDGPNLKEYLRGRGQLSPADATHIMRDVLHGLQAIHDAGIVHRDVKPQNVLIDSDGTAKLSDFGIARGALDAGLTDTGMALGTAAYMAPEQARAGELGPATDLYAAGVLLFEMLTGRLTFPGENPLQVMYQHVNEPPPDPREFNAAIPVGLALTVLKALAKEPGDRFASGTEMLEAIERPPGSEEATRIMSAATPDRTRQVAAAPGGRGRRPPPPTRRTRAQRQSPIWPIALVAGILILVAIAGIWYLASREEATVPDPTPTPVIEPSPTPEPEPTPTPEPEPTPTPEPEPTPTPEPQPTPTPEPEPTPTPEPEPTPTPEPEPTPAPEPTPDEGNDDEDAGVGSEWGDLAFNALVLGAPSSDLVGSEFDGSFVPEEWEGIPEESSFLYSQATDFAVGEAEFESDSDSGNAFVGVEMRAMNDPESESVPIQIEINGVRVYRGDSPFPSDDFDTVRWVYRGSGAIQDGENEIVITNLADDGQVGNPPWILIESVTLYYR